MSEPSVQHFWAESSDKGLSAQYLRPNFQPIYHQGQRHHNALDIVPFLSDQLGIELAAGFENHLVIVLARMLEAVKRGANGIIKIPVAGRKLIAEQVQDGEIDGVGAVGIGRMDFRLDVTGIVVQDIEDIVGSHGRSRQ